MRLPGQLPSFDLLMAASRIFKTSIHVYFWPDKPVIYQFEPYDRVLQLQCLSGIHFNPLIELISYKSPNVNECSMYTSQCPETPSSFVNIDNVDDNNFDFENVSINIVDSSKYDCSHIDCSLPQVNITKGDVKCCAIIDTGAEISLMSSSILDRLNKNVPVQVVEGHMCDIVGFSGHRKTITRACETCLNIDNFKLSVPHKFAVVDSSCFPYCVLLGYDFIKKYQLEICCMSNQLKQGGKVIGIFKVSSFESVSPVVLSIAFSPTISHTLQVKCSDNELRFELEGATPSVTGLALIKDIQSLKLLQSSCGTLRTLYRLLNKETNPRFWPEKVKQFKRHRSKLSIEGGLLIHNSVVVVPFHFLVGTALVLHNQLAHVGRDKLMNIIDSVFWHPARYSVCDDVCSTCANCQITKDFRMTVTPPVQKIQSSYPFELVAADLVSFPRSRHGKLGCLTVVDHYSKWVVAIPIKDKRSSTIVRAFRTQVFPFVSRIPTSILTDNGSEFTSEEFGAFLEEHGVKHRLTTPYQPTSNGAIERVNRTIKNLLRSLGSAEGEWEDLLPRAIITYNNTVHVELGMSPSDFLLKRSHSMELNSLLHPLVDTWRPGHPNFMPFCVGQKVLLKRQTRGFLCTNKFLPNFQGPFEVVVAHPNGLTYEIKDVKSGQLCRAHYTKLRLFKSPPDYILTNSQYDTNDNVTLNDKDNESVTFPDMYGSCGGFSDSSLDSSSESSSGFSGFTQVVPLSEVHLQPVINETEPSPNRIFASTGDSCTSCWLEKIKDRAIDIENLAKSLAALRSSLGWLEGTDVSYLNNQSVGSEPFNEWNLLDWSFSSTGTFELPSIDSTNVIDSSREHESHSLILHLSSPRVNLLSSSDFEGFDNEERLSEYYQRPVKIRNILNSAKTNYSFVKNTPSVESFNERHLRSKGPIKDIPWVQIKTLERVKLSKVTHKYDSA